jgi:hypothetical protein
VRSTDAFTPPKHALAGVGFGATAPDVAASLAETDHLFAALVRSWEVDGWCAQRIETVRDDLSGCLLAVADLDDARAPSVAVLRRGVESATSKLRAVMTGA